MSKIVAALAVLIAIAAAVLFLYGRGDEEALVVYCAHDAIYSEAILQRFEEETGIPLRIRFDSEATKSLGLTERLRREGADGPCDVFWNNELLGTLDLLDAGLLAPYQGPGWQRIPAAFKDPEGRWTGFGARLRVWILHEDAEGQVAEPEALLQEDPSQVAIAKPLYGTTRTHYTVLWQRWGAERLKEWHHQLRQQGLREVNGNGASMRLVADGVCAAGWTDTDDAFLALDDGKPVRMQPVRLADGATIAIPNTVSIIRGSRHRQAAERLVDWLLSAEIELALAASASRQIPLGPVDGSRLPAGAAELADWAADGVDLSTLGPSRGPCLDWLQEQYRQ